jgi:hypothetical protein
VSARTSTNPKKVRDVPEGKPFAMLSAELLASAAWRARSINTIRLIDFLLIEHMNHGGVENGFLLAPWNQLEPFGIGRRLLGPAIAQAVELGLLEVERGKMSGARKSRPSLYRLTFVKARMVNEFGVTYYVEPSNEWRRYKADGATENRIPGSPSCTGTVHLRTPTRVSRPPPSIAKPLISQTRPKPVTVHEGEHLSISWPGQSEANGSGSPPPAKPVDHDNEKFRPRLNFAAWLRTERRARDITTNEMAELIKVGPRDYERIEAGTATLSIHRKRIVTDYITSRPMTERR